MGIPVIPEPARATFDQGVRLEASGRFAEAARCFQQILEDFPQSATVRLQLARVLGARRSEDESFREAAIAECRRLVDEEANDSDCRGQAYFLLASLLDDCPERYGAAAEAYAAGLALDNAFPVAHNNYGAVLCELGRYDEAEEHFFQAISLRPAYTKVYQNLAKMYFRYLPEQRLVGAVERLSSKHGGDGAASLHQLMVALVDFARQDAYEDFYSRGHRLKNLFAIMVSRTRRFNRKRANDALDDEAMAVALEGLLKAFHEATSELKEFLALLRPQPTSQRRVDLNVIVRQVATSFAQTDCDVSFELCDGIPQVVGDPVALHEALTNLARNALDTMADGGRLHLTTSFDASRFEVVVAVEDSGPGVPDDLRREVFRPGVTTKSGGNGLGLAVVRRVAHYCGGRAFVEASAALGGARFVIALPAVEGAVAVIGRGLGDRRSELVDTSSLIADELTEAVND